MTDQHPDAPAPVQRLAPGVVLLTGAGVDAARYAAAVAIRARHRNGMSASRDLERLYNATTMSATGQTDLEPSLDADDDGVTEWATTEEAATLLGCSARHARRLAPRLGGRRAGRGWLIDRQALTEHQKGATP